MDAEGLPISVEWMPLPQIYSEEEGQTKTLDPEQPLYWTRLFLSDISAVESGTQFEK